MTPACISFYPLDFGLISDRLPDASVLIQVCSMLGFHITCCDFITLSGFSLENQEEFHSVQIEEGLFGDGDCSKRANHLDQVPHSFFLLSVEEDVFSLSPAPLPYLPCFSSVSCLLFGASFCISSKF
ncbi:hypothetical protein ATANTOWER_004727 [Ataeniobius toweri]|uniref:Uncharacterized protein n=1 Tax=Ataeniobius toweri TaxID=208326 RepID=A0ABU7AE21_9TELE|nr:hypothetical protein [Ataeniobius toweri]